MAKELAREEISHNDIGVKDRGTWRKYNPYNPYVEEKEGGNPVENLKVESLDDLFDDDPVDKKEENKPQPNSSGGVSSTTPILDLEDFTTDAPILPQEQERNDDSYDLQKELEAKFDELFGPID